MGKIQNFVEDLRKKPFIQSLINDLKSDVYVIGGVVRDLILNKQNKDIDIIVRKVPIDTLISQLQKFGRVDVVGKAFGVIKFIDKDKIDYDIALPRKEKPTGEGGYRGFDVQSDENLPIEDDLTRRDAKMNAMAINLNTGKFIDPLNGLNDIENKQISAANPEAFSDDPLRMIRMIQFASRFGFTIEPETMKTIQNNANRIKEISPERILTEFNKIIKKGNVLTGVQLLINTGLFTQIFGKEVLPSVIDRRNFTNVKTMGEFLFLMTNGIIQNPAEFYKNNLKGDIDTYKEIKAYELAFDDGEETNLIIARTIAHNMYLFSPQSLQSQILPKVIETAAQELSQNKYPKTVNELMVNGNDLIQKGLSGKEIGDMQKSLLLKVYANNVRNNREDLLSLVGQKSNLKEETSEKIEYGALMLFLNIPIWDKITSVIKKEDIYDKEGFGVETEPHLTILYGFHDEVTADQVFGLYKEKTSLKPIKININGISIFKNPEFDVVKFDVKSELLTEINSIMRELPNTTDFPTYHPHITISYVKSGEGDKYIKQFEKERKIIGDKLVFSNKNEEKKILILNEKDTINEEYGEVDNGKYLVNNEIVNINFFIKKYDEWNNDGYKDPTEISVLEFFQNNYEDFSHNEKLKKELLWALTDRDLLKENIESTR